MNKPTPAQALMKACETLKAYASRANWTYDNQGIPRCWLEPGSITPDTYGGDSLAVKALAEIAEIQEPIPLTPQELWDTAKATIGIHEDDRGHRTLNIEDEEALLVVLNASSPRRLRKEPQHEQAHPNRSTENPARLH